MSPGGPDKPAKRKREDRASGLLEGRVSQYVGKQNTVFNPLNIYVTCRVIWSSSLNCSFCAAAPSRVRVAKTTVIGNSILAPQSLKSKERKIKKSKVKRKKDQIGNLMFLLKISCSCSPSLTNLGRLRQKPPKTSVLPLTLTHTLLKDVVLLKFMMWASYNMMSID